MVFHSIKSLNAFGCVVLALFSLTCYSQSQQQADLADKFLTSEFVNGKENAGLNAIPSFHQRESTQGFQYFSHQWLRGAVIYTDTQLATISETPLNIDYSRFYNFDKYNNKLISTQNGKNVLSLSDDAFKGFILIDSGKAYLFKRIPAISKSKYLQLLIESEHGYSLYKRTITTLSHADYQNIGYGKTGKNYDEYIDSYEYYIVFPAKKEFKKLSLNVSSIKKTLKANSAEVEEFFKQNQGTITEELFYNLILFLNNKISS